MNDVTEEERERGARAKSPNPDLVISAATTTSATPLNTRPLSLTLPSANTRTRVSQG